MFISTAYAAAAPAQASAGSGLMSFLPMILIVVVFYFMLIRPQMKRAKEQQKMIDSLQKGDEVVTNGGLLGRIAAVNEGQISLEIARGVEVQLQKAAIQAVLPKGSVSF